MENKKRKKDNTLWIILGIAAAGGAVYFATRKTVAEKRAFLQNIDGQFKADPWDRMTDQEINDAYTAMTEYFLKGRPLPEDSSLRIRLLAISNKYNIFT